MAMNFDAWSWPPNVTYTGSRWIITPNVNQVDQRSFNQKVTARTRRQTHTGPNDLPGLLKWPVTTHCNVELLRSLHRNTQEALKSSLQSIIWFASFFSAAQSHFQLPKVRTTIWPYVDKRNSFATDLSSVFVHRPRVFINRSMRFLRPVSLSHRCGVLTNDTWSLSVIARSLLYITKSRNSYYIP